MIENQKMLLYVALAFVCFSLWGAWQKDYGQKNQATSAQTTSISSSPLPSALPTPATQATPVKPNSGNLVTVKTPLYNAQIDLQGGNLVSMSLPKYPDSIQTPNVPYDLLSSSPDDFYIAESALVGTQGPDTATNKAIYTTNATTFSETDANKNLMVNLNWTNNAGLIITKTYTFHANNYVIDVAYHINNQTNQPFKANYYTQLTRTNPATKSKGMFQIHPYAGAAVSSPNDRYQEISFNKMQEQAYDQTIQGGWAAMVEHYFLTAWVPNPNVDYRYYTNATNGVYTVGMLSPSIDVAPNSQTTVGSQLYAGPEVADALAKVAPGLDQTVSYGFLWPISVLIFWLMKHIYQVIGNWGWAIVFVTVIIKLMFYHLSATSYRSMAKMRKVQPKIEAIRERYADDKQKLSQAMMEIYKTDKINPLGGCLPILVQIPVFFALYMVLVETVQLRQAPFILWIHDLSIPDPYYILPVIMGITMFIQQKLNPAPADPTQAKVMMFLPVIFTFLFLGFPSGLVLYWVVNNGLSIIQQWYIMRQVEKQPTFSRKRDGKKAR